MTARDRHFYNLPKNDLTGEGVTGTEGNESLLKYISHNLIGSGKVFSGPFGLRKCE